MRIWIEHLAKFCAIPGATIVSWFVLAIFWTAIVAEILKKPGSGDLIFVLMVPGYFAFVASLIATIVITIYWPTIPFWPRVVYAGIANFLISLATVIWACMG